MRRSKRSKQSRRRRKQLPKRKGDQPTKKQKVEVSSTVAKQGRVMQAMVKTLAQTQAALSSLSTQSSKSSLMEAAVGSVSIEDTPSNPKNNTAQMVKQANASVLKL